MNVKVLIDPRGGSNSNNVSAIQFNNGSTQKGISLSNKLFGNIKTADVDQQNLGQTAIANININEGGVGSTLSQNQLLQTVTATSPGKKPNFAIPILQNIQNKAKEIAKVQKYAKYDKNSLYCFKREYQLRKFIIWLITSKYFDYFIIALIIVNSLCLAIRDYKDSDSKTKRNQTLDIMDIIFTVFYTTECALKIIAMGLVFSKNSYLRDPWNNLDFAVVIIGLISILPNVPSLKALRTLRVLRPLRSVKAVPSMKRLVGSLLLSLPQMLNVVLFLLFIFMIFGILGIQTFQGDQYNRCRLTPHPVSSTSWPIDPTQNRLCSGLYDCNEGTYCGSLSSHQIDVMYDNVTSDPLINYNINNFDNIFYGLLSIFQCITLEGWTAMMYNYMDGSGWLAYIYFPLLVVIGSFFLLNLFLAVIMKIFTEMDERQKEEERDRKRKENLLLGIKEFSVLDKLQLPQQSEVKGKKQKKQKKPRMNEIFQSFRKLNQEPEQTENLVDQPPVKTEQKPSGIVIEKFNGNLESRSILIKLRYFFYKVCNHQAFQITINLSIIINTIILSLDSYPQDMDLQEKLDKLNVFFFCIFFSEMIIKLMGLGLKNYVKDKFNLFDGFIVILSIIDVIINYSIGTSGKGAVSAFRAFRLLRVFKLAKSWDKFQELLKTVANSLKDISSFSILLFLFMFTYVLLGLEIFAHQVKFDEAGNLDIHNGTSPRINFDDFFNAFITIFIVLTGENWDAIMYDFTRAKGSIAILFFVSFVVIGQLILLNLFLAILLKNFDESSIVQRKETTVNSQPRIALQAFNFIKEYVMNIKCIKQRHLKYKMKKELKQLKKQQKNEKLNQDIEKQVNQQTQENNNDIKIEYFGQNNKNSNKNLSEILDQDQSRRKPSFDDIQDSVDISRDFDQSEREKINKTLGLIKNNPLDLFSTQKRLMQENGSSSIYKRRQSIANIITAKMKDNKNENQNGICKGNSLFILKKNSKFRIFIAKLTKSSYFDYTVLIIISIQSILLALDNPLNDPDGSLVLVLYYTDLIFTTLFVIESILKIITLGLIINGSQSYLRNLWNIADFSIVIISVLSIFYTNSRFNSIKAIRMLRVLRPLRIISRNQGLKVAVSALLMALPNILNVIIISLLFYVIFGIIGINYFKGSFFSCYTDNSYTSSHRKIILQNVYDKFDCLNYGGIWVNHDQNFDNIIQAILTLFQVSTTEGWVEVMHYGEDSIGIDIQPQLYSTPYWNVFFIFFIIVGNFFVLNLFVGVVISTFNREKEVLGKNFLLTNQQKQWLEQKKLCIQVQPKITNNLTHENKIREFIRKVVIHKCFEITILIIIILNTIVLMITWFGQVNESIQILENVNYLFAAIFTLEAILKLIGLGLKKYFSERWNWFDFIVVIGTILSILLTAFTEVTIGAATTFIRAFRISRIFRLIKRARRLKVIFETFLVTIPALTNVGGLLVLFLYIYAILGVQLFATVKLQKDLDFNANFQTFGNAFLTLIRCSTGEAWNAIMVDTTRQATAIFDCDDTDFEYQRYQQNGEQAYGCGSNAGFIFFTSYFLVVPLIFLNLFIAIILQGFEDMNQKEMILIKEDQLEQFRNAWAIYDPNGTGFIGIQELPMLLFDLGSPLGWDTTFKDNIEKQDDFLEEMHIATYNQFKDYLFWDVLQSLTKILIVKQGAERSKLQNNANSSANSSFAQSPNTKRIKSEEEEKDDSSIMYSSYQKFERRIQIRLELEFENYDVQRKDVLAVQDIKKKELNIKKNVLFKQDNHLTSAHVKAGRKIYQAMQRLKVRATERIQNRKKFQLQRAQQLNHHHTPADSPSTRKQKKENKDNEDLVDQEILFMVDEEQIDRPANHQDSFGLHPQVQNNHSNSTFHQHQSQQMNQFDINRLNQENQITEENLSIQELEREFMQEYRIRDSRQSQQQVKRDDDSIEFDEEIKKWNDPQNDPTPYKGIKESSLKKQTSQFEIQYPIEDSLDLGDSLNQSQIKLIIPQPSDRGQEHQQNFSSTNLIRTPKRNKSLQKHQNNKNKKSKFKKDSLSFNDKQE
eukprot:403357086